MSSHRSMKGLALLLTVAAAGAAGAQVTNGSFEQNGQYSTTLTGWSTYGNKAVFTTDTTLFHDPTAGTYQAHISSNTDGSDGEPDGNGLPLAYSASGTNDVENFLGVNLGSLAGASNTVGLNGGHAIAGSKLFRVGAMKQTVHLKVGDKITFDYQMLSLELYKANNPADSSFNYRPTDSGNDFGFFSVSGGGVKSVTKLYDTFFGYQNLGSGDADWNTGYTETPYDPNTNIGDLYYMEAPYKTYSFTAAAESDYTLGFGVSDVFTGNNQGSSGLPSGLSIDNVRYTAAPVPEPASMLALGLGAAAMLRRRKRA